MQDARLIIPSTRAHHPIRTFSLVGFPGRSIGVSPSTRPDLPSRPVATPASPYPSPQHHPRNTHIHPYAIGIHLHAIPLPRGPEIPMRLRPCRGADADIAVYLRGGAVGEGGVVDVGEVLAKILV